MMAMIRDKDIGQALARRGRIRAASLDWRETAKSVAAALMASAADVDDPWLPKEADT
jgi:hypothetical protein